MEAEMKRLRDQHDQVLTAQTSHLVAQKKQLRMQLQLLHAHSHSSSHRPTYEDKVSENDMPSVNSQNRNQSSSHSKSHTINTSISKRNSVRGTAENKKDFVDPLITLQNVVTQAKSRFLNLERRNQLEMEGYANEVLFLRQRLRQLEKSRVRMSQYESFS